MTTTEHVFDTDVMALPDPDWRGMGEFSPHLDEVRQEVRNTEWPAPGIAKLLPMQPPVPVEARVVFAGDGEEWLPGVAVRWVRPVVFVQVSDKRVQGYGLWLPAGDVRRKMRAAGRLLAVPRWTADYMVGCRVQALMDQHGDLQADIAQLLGIQQQGFGKKLRGENRWHLDEVLILCRHYGVGIGELVEGNEP